MLSAALKKAHPPIDSLPAVWGVLDWHAESNPTSLWVIFPTPDGQFNSLTMLEYALASHKVAHALRPGRNGPEGEVITFLLNCDSIHYCAMIAGAIRAGLVPFPMSPRVTPEAVASMMEKTNCHRILSQSSLNSLVQSTQALLSRKNHAVRVDELPPLDFVFASLSKDLIIAAGNNHVPRYPQPTKAHQPNDIIYYLHSSGSTGLPKPIPHTQKTVECWETTTFVKMSRECNMRWGSMNLPTFHAMGMVMQFHLPLANAQPWVAYEPRYPAPPVMASAHVTLEVARAAGCDGLVCVPTFVEAFSESEEAIKYLATLRVLMFGGGPLLKVIGDELTAAGIRLGIMYGGTEWGTHPDVFRESDLVVPKVSITNPDWEWISFSKEVQQRWVPQGDGSYELEYLTCETHQPSIENLPDTKGYATSDLFVPHPTKPGLWRIIGRTDDVIVLGSGEKVVPNPQENFLGSQPFVKGAVMFGRGRNEPGVLLEPRPEYGFDPSNTAPLVEFRNNFWPYVEEANKLAPSFARIFKEMIIVTHPDRPMERASKGTVLRKKTLLDYDKEIEKLYETVQASTDSNGVSPPDSWSTEDIEVWLSKHAASINEGNEPSSSVDLFEQGFDSLSATFLRNRIIGALRSSPDATARSASLEIFQDFVFANPTLEKLAHAIARAITADTSAAPFTTTADEINHMIGKYSAELPQVAGKVHVRGGDLVVLLTGSTGGLGSHLLALLLMDPRVKKVFTLDRGLGISSRRKASFEEAGLPVEVLMKDKLTTLSVNYGRPDFGLGADVLDELKRSITHIIHNAWRVDFNLSLGSFESNIRNTRELLDFSASCTHGVHFIFCSSVASVKQWDVTNGPVPEVVLEDPVLVGSYGEAGSYGYAESKFVAERIMANAVKKGHNVTTLRIGQISGSVASGVWKSSNWVPLIVKSSISLGYLPDLDGGVSWASMDIIGQTIMDLLTPSTSSPEVLHVVHPRPRPWKDVMADINDALEGSLPFISFDKWVSKLEAASVNATEHDLEIVPAIKIIRFLKQVRAKTAQHPSGSALPTEADGLPVLDTTKAQSVSPTLRNAKPLSREEVGMWVKYWRSQGFIQ